MEGKRGVDKGILHVFLGLISFLYFFWRIL